MMKEDVLKYLELQTKLYHFEAIEKIGELRSKLLFRVISTLFFFTFLMFLGLAIALFVNYLLDSVYIGFAVVTAFFFLMLMIMYFCKSKIKAILFHSYINKNIPS